MPTSFIFFYFWGFGVFFVKIVLFLLVTTAFTCVRYIGGMSCIWISKKFRQVFGQLTRHCTYVENQLPNTYVVVMCFITFLIVYLSF